METADSILEAYHSISILSTLHQLKTLPQRIEAAKIERVICLFKTLSDSQGRFKMSSSSPKRSILATGLVYRTLADARSLDINLSDEAEGIVEEIRASLAQARLICALQGSPYFQTASLLLIWCVIVYHMAAALPKR